VVGSNNKNNHAVLKIEHSLPRPSPWQDTAWQHLQIELTRCKNSGTFPESCFMDVVVAVTAPLSKLL